MNTTYTPRHVGREPWPETGEWIPTHTPRHRRLVPMAEPPVSAPTWR